MANLGHEISDQTVGNVLRRHGLPPTPERKRTTTWAAFIRTHLALLSGTDFFIAEVLTLRGLVTCRLGGELLALPARNAYAERWVRSVKEKCLSRVILFGKRSLRRALSNYVDHLHAEWNHKGKGNVLLFPRANGSAARRASEVPRDWMASCAITIERRRDAPSAGSVF